MEMFSLVMMLMTVFALVDMSIGGSGLSSASDCQSISLPECLSASSANHDLSSPSLYLQLDSSSSSTPSSLTESSTSSSSPSPLTLGTRQRKEGLENLRAELKDRRFATVDAETMKQWLTADLGKDNWQMLARLLSCFNYLSRLTFKSSRIMDAFWSRSKEEKKII